MTAPGRYGPDPGFQPRPRAAGPDAACSRADVHGRLPRREARPAAARREPWRVVLVVLGCLVGPPAGAVAGLVGAVTYSGCFLSCDEPRPLLGGALVLLGLLLLLAGPLLAALLLRRPVAVGLALVGILGGLGLGLSLAAFL